jgi:hypothetical protein
LTSHTKDRPNAVAGRVLDHHYPRVCGVDAIGEQVRKLFVRLREREVAWRAGRDAQVDCEGFDRIARPGVELVGSHTSERNLAHGVSRDDIQACSRVRCDRRTRDAERQPSELTPTRQSGISSAPAANIQLARVAERHRSA